MSCERTSRCASCGRPVFAFVAAKTGGLCRGCEHRFHVRAAAGAPERSADDLESFCLTVFEKAHSKWFEHGRAALSTGEITVIAVETFFGETCNGGIEQYLGNESGEFAADLPEALARVGLMSYVPIAIELRRVDADLEELTNRFFELHDHTEDEFREALAAYIRNHEDQFTV